MISQPACTETLSRKARPAGSGRQPAPLFPPMYRGENAVIEALFWREEAATFRQVAHGFEDPEQQQELLQLAQACEAVALSLEHRSAVGPPDAKAQPLS